MNILAVRILRSQFIYLRLINNVHRIAQNSFLVTLSYSPTIDAVDAFTMEVLQRYRKRSNSMIHNTNSLSVRYLMDQEPNTPDVTKMTKEELDSELLQLMTTNNGRQMKEIVNNCVVFRKTMSDITLKKLFRNYSVAGNTDLVEKLQEYCLKIDPVLYKVNGHFIHFLAVAQCMKGNSDKGLSILTDCYKQNKGMRSYYRIVFRELIQDTVLNRSEASLVIFKRYVLEFSDKYEEHYPLVCFWHNCWSSSWFSDQTLSDDLLEASRTLLDIVRNKARVFTISILWQKYNEDAVIRLLQILLKYDMMSEYEKVLEVLFDYKLKNRDIRGCAEIIQNCEVLGVTLPANYQGRYIRMLIDGKRPVAKPDKPSSTTFKLKF